MKKLFWILVLITLCCAPVAQAGWFGESEEEKEARIAKHVADVLREPNRVIANAQEAVEYGDIEEGIRLFRKAHAMIEQIEVTEDTSGSAFATLRLRKFHCVSMLDALALKQAEVMDVRQAVTDTSDLAKRLAQERKELAEQSKAEANPNDLPRPPTLRDQLAIEESKVLVAQDAVNRCRTNVEAALCELDVVKESITETVKAHTVADTTYFMAEQRLRQAEANPKDASVVDALRVSMEAAKRDLVAKKTEMAAAKKKQAAIEAQLKDAEAKLKDAEAKLEEARRPVVVLRKAIAEEMAVARKRAAEEKAKADAAAERLAADNLKQRQAEAAAATNAREKQAKNSSDAKALQKELDICEELWKMKQIESFERRVTAALEKWPDSSDLLVQLARLRLVQGQEDDALELVAMTTGKGEAGKKAAYVAAGAYMVKQKPLDAMKVLEPIMEAYPNDPDVYYNMAVVLVRLPEIDPKREIAAKYYTRSVELGGRRSFTLERRLDME
jgi:thioredoxin-like negative regulator of GroEL